MTRLTIRVDFDSGGSIGPGKIQLLEGVAELGSIRKAAARSGMSFRQGWLLLQAAEAIFGEPLTETVRGGARGGGTRLTPLGKLVVSTYRMLEKSASRAAEPEVARLTQRIGNTSLDKRAGREKGALLRHKSLKKKK